MSKLVVALVLAAFIAVSSPLSAQQGPFTTEEVPYTPTMFTVSPDGSVTSRPLAELQPPLPPAQWVAECPFRPGCADSPTSFLPCPACAETLRAMNAEISRNMSEQIIQSQLSQIQSELAWLSLQRFRTSPPVIFYGDLSQSLIPLMSTPLTSMWGPYLLLR